MAIPAILFGLYQKSKDSKEKERLEQRVEHYNRDRVLVDDLDRDFGQALDHADRKEGQDILGDLFGNDKNDVAADIANKAGVSQEEVDAVLEKLAPTITAMLAKEKAKGRDLEEVTRQEIEDLDQDDDFNLADIAGTIFNRRGASGGADDLLGTLGNVIGKFL